MEHQHYNEVNRFANPTHEALMGVCLVLSSPKKSIQGFSLHPAL